MFSLVFIYFLFSFICVYIFISIDPDSPRPSQLQISFVLAALMKWKSSQKLDEKQLKQKVDELAAATPFKVGDFFIWCFERYFFFLLFVVVLFHWCRV